MGSKQIHVIHEPLRGQGDDLPRGKVEIKSQGFGVRKKEKGGREEEEDRVGRKRGTEEGIIKSQS